MKPQSISERIIIIGNSCAGKSTLARQISTVLGVEHVELDALYWEPNWKESENEVFRARVAAALNAKSWVVDGNYTSKIKDVAWPLADTLVWLDPPLAKILLRLFIRSFRRSIKGELLWGRCRETLRNSIFSRNSLLMWVLSTYRRKAEEFKALVDRPPKGVTVLRLRTDNQIRGFLESLSVTEQ